MHKRLLSHQLSYTYARTHNSVTSPLYAPWNRLQSHTLSAMKMCVSVLELLSSPLSLLLIYDYISVTSSMTPLCPFHSPQPFLFCECSFESIADKHGFSAVDMEFSVLDLNGDKKISVTEWEELFAALSEDDRVCVQPLARAFKTHSHLRHMHSKHAHSFGTRP